MKFEYRKPDIKEYQIQTEGALLNISGGKEDYGEAIDGNWT